MRYRIFVDTASVKNVFLTEVNMQDTARDKVMELVKMSEVTQVIVAKLEDG